jgi:putative peptidoglycan binding protein/rare lipoprotein A (RlpA)-like double-psi beta-barrel protein
LDRRFERRRAPARSARRRPPTYNSRSGPRPDRVAAWAFGLGILLILLAATTSNGQTGGVPAQPGAGQAPPMGPVAPQLGQRVLGKGAAGDDVKTLQQMLRTRGYGSSLTATGVFDEATEQAVRGFQRAAGLAVDGVVGPQTRPALVAMMRILKATWYGPGLYGKRTACGQRLRPGTLGVAHRTLPCGTRVTFYHDGHFVTVAVIDRGPFRRGVAWDLTAAAASRLGFRSPGQLRSVP